MERPAAVSKPLPSPAELLALVQRIERAMAAEFGIHPHAMTGRATERRCFLASAALAEALRRCGYRAEWVAGTLSVEHPAAMPLDLTWHAVVVLEEQLLIDPSIAQAHRARWAPWLDVDLLTTDVSGPPRDGARVRYGQATLTLEFTCSDALTRDARLLPDAEPARSEAILARLERLR